MSFSIDSIFTPADEVSELFFDDFDDRGRLIKRKYRRGITIIMFYSPRCGHCHHTKPTYTWLSNLLDTTKFHFTAINCSQTPDIVPTLEKRIQGVSIEGFPTILKFKNGKYTQTLQGDRSKDGLFRFVVDV